jgi:magnesium-transporting ATPase (P-type)
VLGRQLRSAVLGLLAVTAVVSFFLGDSTQAIIIGVILAASIGLGFVNEYRAERATAALHSRVHHSAVVRREGHFIKVDVTDLVPGDVIRLALGETVPADVRLIEVTELECNEGILSVESSASEKSLHLVKRDAALADSTDLAFMGTIVSAGEGVGDRDTGRHVRAAQDDGVPTPPGASGGGVHRGPPDARRKACPVWSGATTTFGVEVDVWGKYRSPRYRGVNRAAGSRRAAVRTGEQTDACR